MKNIGHLAAALLIAASLQAPLVGRACAQSRTASSPQASLDALLAADRAYSDLASRTSLGRALAAMLDEAVVMPLPNASFAHGRADVLTAFAAGPAFATRAQWTPIGGGLSGDGSHGFTYGYTSLLLPDGTARPGKYLAYWVRRPEGWRVALYKRAPRPPGEVDVAMRRPLLPPRLIARRAPPPEAARTLGAAERAFSDEAQRAGLRRAFAHWGSAEAMNVGRQPAFLFGADTIAAEHPDEVPSPVRWGPDEGVLVAPSGDLGVTWGWIRLNEARAAGQPAAYPFFTVWRRASPHAPWRYVAE